MMKAKVWNLMLKVLNCLNNYVMKSISMRLLDIVELLLHIGNNEYSIAGTFYIMH